VGGNAKNILWCCTRSKTLPHGVGFGGDVPGAGIARLWVDADMDLCRAGPTDATFETGLLRGGATTTATTSSSSSSKDKDSFKPTVIEVWGLGTDTDLAA
jgi:hypothetical protein